LAIQRRAQEIQDQKEKEEASRKDREGLERQAQELERIQAPKYPRCTSSQFVSHRRAEFNVDDDRGPDRYGDRDRDRGRGRDDRHGYRDRDRPPPQPPANRGGYQNVPTGPRADRNRGPPAVPANNGAYSSSMPPPPPPTSTTSTSSGGAASSDPSDSFVPALTDNDLSAIRSRYLGVDKKKRKIRKMNDRKFVFDWDTQEDTLAEDSLSAVGSNRQGAQIMFGRGHLAGMDDGGGSGPRKSGSAPVDPHLADAMERRKALKAGYDDRHWTDKALQEMKERDWRIFREDFSISARGIFDLSVSSFRQLTPVLQAATYLILYGLGKSQTSPGFCLKRLNG
jgi:ATP-dependent RNA helicase DDX23/PRP28